MSQFLRDFLSLLRASGIPINNDKLLAYMNTQTVNGNKIYNTAKALLGKHLATNAMLGCAESVNYVVHAALGRDVGGGASTALMYEALLDHKRFVQVTAPQPGDILISPTGHGNGRMAHGHTGIVAKYGILSNNSEDGAFEENYTLDTWRKLFVDVGGFPMVYFRKLDNN